MLIVFDFDSTLLDGESIDIFAKVCGAQKEISNITNEAMNGRLDFFHALKKRVSLLKGTRLDILQKSVRCDFHLMNGAVECVQELKKRGHIVVCFSGGFRIVTDYFKDILGLNATFSNILHTMEDENNEIILSGEVGGEMMFSDSKGIMLQNLASLLDIEKDDCVAIGDGANDLSMFKYAGTKIAFCAKEILQKEATHIINNKDLREILQIIA